MSSADRRRTYKMSLSGLPNELLIHLSEFLDWQSLKRFRSLSRRFFDLIPKDSLRKYHAVQSRILYEEENLLLKEITKFYWEEAEESFLGYHSSSYTSSSLDPDLRAHEERLTCTHHKLPCYHCLSWKPSLTDSPTFENLSAFSRGMSTGSRNLGSKHASTRICIDCGIRTRLYNRGTVVKHSAVCNSCRELTAPFRLNNVYLRFDGPDWLSRYLCHNCCANSKYSNLTMEQYAHESRWEKYEKSMTDGKMYRLEKGRGLRGQATINGPNDGQVLENKSYVKPRYCPVMKEMRLCNCLMRLHSDE